jgi:hypothetical protein
MMMLVVVIVEWSHHNGEAVVHIYIPCPEARLYSQHEPFL